MTITELLNLAVQKHRAGQWAEAEAAYRQAIAIDANRAEALQGLGLLAHRDGRTEEAVALLQRAAELSPASAQIRMNLSAVLDAMGQTDEAIEGYRTALALNPRYAGAMANLGDALRRTGKTSEGIEVCGRAAALQPDLLEAQRSLAIACMAGAEWQKSLTAFDKAISLRPENAELYRLRGESLLYLGRYDECIAEMQKAMSLEPNLPEAHTTLGNAWAAVGEVDRGIACLNRALEISPQAPVRAGNRLYLMLFSARYSAMEIRREHELWDFAYASALERNILPHDNDRSPGRRLRIGYVSPNFRQHCQAHFMLPLLAHHDRNAVEVCCYSSTKRPDEVTRRVEELANLWRPIGDLDDAASADVIRADRVDILIDLTMHMGDQRPLLFARKPAPVQVAWLAYPGTTGLAAMDYRLTDPRLDPPGESGRLYTEKSIRLPDAFWCFDPVAGAGEHAGSVPELPLAANGCVTFGCMNNFSKLNIGTMALWSRVMNLVPRSRLLLLAPQGECRRRVTSTMGHLGVESGRIEFIDRRPRLEYLANFGRIDISLDTLPYNGHTTSMDSFWMGVPVISRLGATVVGRAGLSQAYQLGLTELVAEDDEKFVKIAVELAGDAARLGELRRTLRERLACSPLMDAKRFAANIEAAYRTMWTQSGGMNSEF